MALLLPGQLTGWAPQPFGVFMCVRQFLKLVNSATDVSFKRGQILKP